MSVVFWDLDDVNNLIIQTRTNGLYVVEIYMQNSQNQKENYNH